MRRIFTNLIETGYICSACKKQIPSDECVEINLSDYSIKHMGCKGENNEN